MIVVRAVYYCERTVFDWEGVIEAQEVSGLGNILIPEDSWII